MSENDGDGKAQPEFLTGGCLSGGCLCGTVRYRVALPHVGRVVHCHCTMCRRASGAPVVDWFSVPLAAFRLTGAPLKVYRSSAHGERGFCPNCGSQITFWSSDYGETVDVTVGSLDHPEAMPPEEHIWTDSRLPWLHLDPDLPDRTGDSDDIPPSPARTPK